MIERITQVVTFLSAVWLFWWSFPLANAAWYVKCLDLQGRRNDIYEWSKFMMACLNTKVRLAGKNRMAVSERPIMYLCNHRSWADFFVDVYLLGGKAMIMSRMAVFFAFPVFMAPVVVLKGILLFKRNITHDKETFNAWLDKERSESLLNAMLVYPEGHRNINPDPLPLKRGMLRYAYARKMLVQVVITCGKEGVLCEKKMTVGIGRELVTGFSASIDPNSFKDVDSFMAEVTRVFEEKWKDTAAQAKDLSSLPLYTPLDELETYDYPMSMRHQMIALFLLSALGMGLIFFLSIKLLGFVKLGMLFAFVGTCAARTSLAKPKQLAEPKKDK